MKTVDVAHESKCVAYLSAVYKDGESITHRASSTGFFWRHSDTPHLITGRHCVTGRNSANRPLGEHPFDPTHLQVYFRTPGARTAKDDGAVYTNQAIQFTLWSGGCPDWIEHPRGSLIDVVAIPLEGFHSKIHCVNDVQQYNWHIPEVGSDCYIVGYPEGIAGSEGTPVWKRASIASEPELPINGMPIFLCDSATRTGMSGSPVFARYTGDFGRRGQTVDPSGGPHFFGHWNQFIGIYSGRQGDEHGFQLAKVWRAETINEMLSSPKKPGSPFQKVNPCDLIPPL